MYSRKVEYLYTLIYQALELLHAQSKKKKVRDARRVEPWWLLRVGTCCVRRIVLV